MPVQNVLTPAPIKANALPTARTNIGAGDLKVQLCGEAAYAVATFTASASSSGSLAIDDGFSAALAASPKHLVMVVDSPVIECAYDPTLVLNVTFDDDSTGTVTFTLKNPDYLNIPASDLHNYGETYAVEGSLAANKKVKSVDSLGAVAHWMKNAVVAFVAIPAPADFVEAGCTTSHNFSDGTSGVRAVPCRLNGSKFVKRARSEPVSLSISLRPVSYTSGALRFRGRPCTAMVQVQKDGTNDQIRLFFVNYRPKFTSQGGEGDDDVTASGEGLAERCIVLEATTTEA